MESGAKTPDALVASLPADRVPVETYVKLCEKSRKGKD